MPKVSIIIPCYNCEESIDETLKSLEAQTEKDIEIICINDGSKDKTLSVLNFWKNRKTLDLVIINQESSKYLIVIVKYYH